MKILLVGEYSRLHNSLKEGLTALGHDVIVVGTGDGFKQYGTDYSIAVKLFETYSLLRFVKRIVNKLTKFDLARTEKGYRFYRLLPLLKGYDHIQLINSDALETHPAFAQWLLKKLFEQNGTMSLLVCGDETPVIDYCLAEKFKYSILTPYLKDKSLKKQYAYSLKYTHKNHRELFNWLQRRAQSIITSDIDYVIPMQQTGYTAPLIPNPINTDTIKFIPLTITNKVVIFLGINRNSYVKKGIKYFEEALSIIQEKYPTNVEIIVTENIPYNEYIKLYDTAHIVLDQVFAYDQGYNALEAMAKGKVVFTGAEAEFTKHYNLTERVAVNALPDTDALVKELSYLIENPTEIITTAHRARAFIEKEHDYIKVAKKYLEVWGMN
ncbi:glycosyl transferase family 1 [Flavobacterium rivuli WB 3.3-2 = DSM 21788]|uniref:Glycosyl transferase family 1 n=1 Tax=Flavobacterium rivuli WB 3.3-2 = DSM 21788 TaxID=1121895 RepID=A0A0A2MHL5_9FLAO|nr:glycosyltransferase [Flavobacterium rivuli]KGO87790.1 glycosyl transferase family 1 [Flavobacterium rivuli WB 3.3-2 = DSM 21788]